MSLLFNTLSSFVIAFLPRSNCLLISWLQSPSTVILEPKTRKSVTTSTFSPSIYHAVMWLEGEGNGTPLQYSCLENPMDGGTIVHGVAESDTNEHLHFHFSLSCIGEGNGNPLQCSCLENPRDGGAWWAAIYVVAQSRTWLKWLSSSSSISFGSPVTPSSLFYSPCNSVNLSGCPSLWRNFSSLT